METPNATAATLEELREQCSKIAVRLDRVETRLDRVETRLDRLEATLVQLIERMARIGARLESCAGKADVYRAIEAQTWKIITFVTGFGGALAAAVFFIARNVH